MPAIGITGGISTGKSTFLGQLRQLLPSAHYFDADRTARLLTDQDHEVRQAIRDAFGDQMFSASGDLNRGAVRAIILQSAAKRVALEQILHPRIRSQWSAEAQRYRNSSDFFFADIPLLYETGGETLCDRVVVIGCSPEVQLRRLLARRGSGEGKQTLITETEANDMIYAQMPLEEKIRRADHVVWNNGGNGVLGDQARDLMNLWLATSWTVK
jgi:dephospho-CoA kinase